MGDVVGISGRGGDYFYLRSNGKVGFIPRYPNSNPAEHSNASNNISSISNIISFDSDFGNAIFLKQDGSIVELGGYSSSWGPYTIIPNSSSITNAVSVVAGQSGAAVLLSDGTVVCGGVFDPTHWPNLIQKPSNLTNVVQLSAYNQTIAALKKDGTVVVWGDNQGGACNVPLGLNNVVYVATGNRGCVAVKSDGSIVTWGNSINKLDGYITNVLTYNIVDIKLLVDGNVYALFGSNPVTQKLNIDTFSPIVTNVISLPLSSLGLAVDYSVISGDAYISNNNVIFKNIGSVNIGVYQAGNASAFPLVTNLILNVSPGNAPFFTTVGDPRNPCEDGVGFDEENAGIGYVGQPYQISVSEITNLMYARFLNAVASGDNFYGLYATRMATDPQGGIIRGGSFPNYTYSVKAGFENRPVNFVSLYSAIRYINWIHNGMPVTRILDDTTTEDGAYTLLGNNIPTITRNASAKYFLPNQDEWHKAAFFDPAPPSPYPSDFYWMRGDQSQNGVGGNFSGTLADVGTSSSTSHYGTYDQDGNVSEWTESVVYNPITGLPK